MDWQYKTDSSPNYCTGWPNGVCPWAKGKAIGGSTAISATAYVRGNRRDYDAWRDMGNVGWGYDDVKTYFKKSEQSRINGLDSDYHNNSGLLTVEYPRFESPLNKVFSDAAGQSSLPTSRDYNGASQLGFGQAQLNLRDGRRCSNGKAFIRPIVHRPNIDIIVGAYVTKVLINKQSKEAYGVKYIRDGKENEVRARKEVILCAGSIQSPQLLMLSGIGASDELRRHGIETIVDSRGVGENLQDHTSFFGLQVLIKATNGPLSCIIPDVLTIESILAFFKGEGELYRAPFNMFAWLNSKLQNSDNQWPDLIFFFAALANPFLDASIAKQGTKEDGFLIYPCVARPQSRGYVKLASNNPLQQPRIVPNYFQSSRDMEILVCMHDALR